HIAQESSKYGFSKEELIELTSRKHIKDPYPNITFKGLMGMATFTDDQQLVRSEFQVLKNCFDEVQAHFHHETFTEISMGMSGDYKLAIEEGSTMVRIGSSIFGRR
ncbi:MAG: alanine racemase, partial [Flavobacteriales bacterium]